MDTSLPVPARALAVGAHPDDIEFGCGATLAKWAAAGCEIFHLVCTDGSKGSWDASTDPAELVVTRRREQRQAALRLGGSGSVDFLPWPDGELESGLRQRLDVAAAIRRLKPEVILGHDPWKRYRLHPDHRNAGLLVTDGIVAARDPLFFPDLSGAPHRPNILLLFEADEVNHVEDVSGPGLVETKIAALLEHKSQLRSTMGITSAAGAEPPADAEPTAEAADTVAFRARVRARLAEHGALAGVEMGEAFHRIDRL